MNTRFYLAVLAASFIAFFGGWLIFGILFEDFYLSNTNETAKAIMKTPPEIWAIALSNIGWSLLLTWVLQQTGNTTFVRGLIISLWISSLIVLIFDLSIYAFWNMYDLGFVVIDVISASVFWGIVGGVAGAILGGGKKAVTS